MALNPIIVRLLEWLFGRKANTYRSSYYVDPLRVGSKLPVRKLDLTPVPAKPPSKAWWLIPFVGFLYWLLKRKQNGNGGQPGPAEPPLPPPPRRSMWWAGVSGYHILSPQVSDGERLRWLDINYQAGFTLMRVFNIHPRLGACPWNIVGGRIDWGRWDEGWWARFQGLLHESNRRRITMITSAWQMWKWGTEIWYGESVIDTMKSSGNWHGESFKNAVIAYANRLATLGQKYPNVLIEVGNEFQASEWFHGVVIDHLQLFGFKPSSRIVINGASKRYADSKHVLFATHHSDALGPGILNSSDGQAIEDAGMIGRYILRAIDVGALGVEWWENKTRYPGKFPSPEVMSAITKALEQRGKLK